MTTSVATSYLPFHVPLIEEDDIQAVVEVLRSGWLTSGPKVLQFEEEFARFVGNRHAIAVNSGTAGLHLALEAIGLRPGDEVLVPTLTFTATAEVVAYCGAKPVLVDSEDKHFNMDVNDLEKHITSRSRAIIPVHFAGHPCDIGGILDFALKHELTVIEDAAHAFPAQYEGRNVGVLSPLTVFSFYATKPITTGEGGMVTTGDESLAERIRSMRLHGMSKDAWKRYDKNGSWRYDVITRGFKYNLTDMQAALGLVQLSKAQAMRHRRSRIAARYTAGLRDLSAFRLPTVEPNVQHAWHLYVVLIDPDQLRLSRDEVMDQLRDRGIGCAVHFIPLHFHSYYKQEWGYALGQFPVAERYFTRCISLPIYPSMTDTDVDRVIEALVDLHDTFSR